MEIYQVAAFTYDYFKPFILFGHILTEPKLIDKEKTFYALDITPRA
jgi:hypothetical protein